MFPYLMHFIPIFSLSFSSLRRKRVLDSMHVQLCGRAIARDQILRPYVRVVNGISPCNETRQSLRDTPSQRTCVPVIACRLVCPLLRPPLPSPVPMLLL